MIKFVLKINIIKSIIKKILILIGNIKFYRLYKTINGNYYLPLFSYGDSVRKDIINGNIYQKEIIDIASRYILANTAVLDLGANFGQMTVEFSKLKKNVFVYSFEAQEFIYKLLKKNVQINKVNAKCFYNLVGNESKIIKIKKNKLKESLSWGTNNIEILNEEDNDQERDRIEFRHKNNDNFIKAIKIDDLEIKEKISFMKIDIQGRDLDALKGARKTILINKMPIIFEYEKRFEDIYNFRFKDFEKFISEINYKIELNIKDDYLIVPQK